MSVILTCSNPEPLAFIRMLMSFVTRHTNSSGCSLWYLRATLMMRLSFAWSCVLSKNGTLSFASSNWSGKIASRPRSPRALSREYPRLLGSLGVQRNQLPCRSSVSQSAPRDSPTCPPVFDVIEFFQNRHWNHDSMFRKSRNRRRIVQQHVGVEYISLHPCRCELR